MMRVSLYAVMYKADFETTHDLTNRKVIATIQFSKGDFCVQSFKEARQQRLRVGGT